MNNQVEALRKYLENRTPEQIEEDKEFFRDKRPKGWLSIEDHLPTCSALDYCNQFYSEFKVRYTDGTEGLTQVGDHHTWYYYAKEIGITHWLNE